MLPSLALPSNNSFTKPAGGMSPDNGTVTSDSGVIAHNVKTDILEDKTYQPENNTDSSS